MNNEVDNVTFPSLSLTNLQVGQKQMLHSFSFVIIISNIGQNDDFLTRFLQFSIPKCPWWTRVFLSAQKVVDTMIRSLFRRIPSQKVISLR